MDPRPLTTHSFRSEEMDKAFHPMDIKEDGIGKPLSLLEG